MENEISYVDKFINNNINIREKIRVEEVIGLMGKLLFNRNNN